MIDPSAATAAEPGRRVASTGETLGKYRLDRVLGEGGMGIVWAAFDPDLERAVALKLLHSGDEPTLRTRLLREAKAMARLKHPNVLTVYEVGTDQNRDYIAMEIVDGDTLSAWLATKPPQTEIIDALLAAGRGLAAAHAASLVHRDFKPHNVLRSRDGHVYVTDFGLARGQIEDGPEVQQVSMQSRPVGPRGADVLASPLTQTGVMIGTPAYMAPEQFAGRIPDARTDQFAFCITAWEALAGTRPFRGETLPELEAAVGAGVHDIASALPPRLRAVIARGLDPSPDARWPDMPSLLAALAEAAAPARRSRKKLAIGAAATLALAGGGIAIYVVATRSPAVKSAGCEPADTAFDTAWSPARRATFLKTHDEDAIGVVVLVDEVRKRWVEAYRRACSAPPTDDTRKQIKCLLGVRTDAQRVTASLADADNEPEMIVLGLGMGLARCTGEKWGLPMPFSPMVTPPEPPGPPAPP